MLHDKREDPLYDLMQKLQDDMTTTTRDLSDDIMKLTRDLSNDIMKIKAELSAVREANSRMEKDLSALKKQFAVITASFICRIYLFYLENQTGLQLHKPVRKLPQGSS